MIDTHLHLWDPAPPELDGAVVSYSWMDGLEMPAVSRPGGDLGPVDAAIIVEGGADARSWDDECSFLDALADSHPWITALVLPVDLGADDASDRIEAAAAHPRAVGLRHNFETLPLGAIGRLVTPPRLDAIGAADLTFDVCVRGDQLDEAAVAFARAPCRLVLDHAGKPELDITTGRVCPTWADAVRAFAVNPRAYCKITGLWSLVPDANTVLCTPEGRNAAVDAAAGHIAVLLQSFGPDRLLLGSDHPVSTVARGLDRPTALEMTREAVRRAGLDITDAHFDANARRAYSLPTVHHQEDTA